MAVSRHGKKKIFNKSFKSSFLIAEAGINHNGSMDTAIKLISEAKKSGADAIKFQTYKTDKRVSKILRFIKY